MLPTASRTSFGRLILQKAQVDTLVGGDLFEFGDVDASGDDVRLQHPLGVMPSATKC